MDYACVPGFGDVVLDAVRAIMSLRRPLKGGKPTIDLVLGYEKSNGSPALKLLLSRLDELVARVLKKADA
jgi:hypothetical protein